MDPGTLVGVISLGIEGIQICHKTFKRFEDYRRSLQTIPDALEACEARLIALQGILKQIALEDGGSNSASDTHLLLTYNIIGKHVNQLNIILNGLRKGPEESRRQLLHKAAKSLRKEPQIEHISKVLSDAVQDLTLGRLQSLKTLMVGHDCLHKAHLPEARQTLAPSYGTPPKQAWRLIGRVETLGELKRELLDNPKETAAISVWSLSGQGKTQTVLELINDKEVKEAFETVIWLNASSVTAIVKQFEKYAIEMSLPGGSFSDAQSKVMFILNTLDAREKPPLFIYDNFDMSIPLNELEGFLPKHRPYTIVYIKQHSDPAFQGKSRMIPALDENKAVELLLERSGQHPDILNLVHCRSIVRRLGCLPLAIVQAGAWLRSSKLPIDQFFTQFNLYFPFVFQNLSSEDIFARNVSTTWALAMEAFSSDRSVRDDMTNMLLFCSIIHNDVMNCRFSSYLWRSMREAPTWTKAFLRDKAWSDSKFVAIIQKLGDYSLVNILDWRDGHCHFSVHPMIRRWIRLRTKSAVLVSTTVNALKYVAAVIDRSGGNPMDLRKTSHFRLYIVSCLQSLAEIQEIEGTSDFFQEHEREILDIKYSFAQFFSTLADFSETSSEKQIPSDINDVMLLKECYEGYSRILGASDPMAIKVGDQLGNAYINQRQFENAESILRELLSVQGRPMSSSLAKCYREQGRTDEANEAYETILSEANAATLPEFELLRSMMGCALNDNAQEQYTRAEKWFREITNIAKPVPDQAKIKGEACENLSDIYWRWGRQIEGVEAQLDAFHMYEIAYGAEDPRTLSIGHQLCRCYFSMNEWFKCEQLYCKIIAGYEAAYGSDSIHTCQARHCHSHTLCALGRREEGEAAHTATFYDLLVKPGVEDEFTRSLFGCVLGVFDHYDVEEKKVELYERTLAKAREAFVETDPFCLRLIRGLARLYNHYERYPEAETLLREVIAAHEAIVARNLGLENTESKDEDADDEDEDVRQAGTAKTGNGPENATDESNGTNGEEAPDQQIDAKGGEEQAPDQQDGDAGVEQETEQQEEGDSQEVNDEEKTQADVQPPTATTTGSEGASRLDVDIRAADNTDGLAKYIDDLEVLSELLCATDRYAEAEPICQKILDLRKEYYVDFDPPTLEAMMQLSKVYESQEKYEEADKYLDEYEEAVKAQMMQQIKKARDEARAKRKAAEEQHQQQQQQQQPLVQKMEELKVGA